MGNDPFNVWTVFLTQMIGLSVATERVTEMIKQWVGPTLSNWLRSSRYFGAVQLIAILSGMFVTALSGLNPLQIPDYKAFEWGNSKDWLTWTVTGILVSGGSAVWNHLLDILQAVKVAKEQALLPAAAPDAAAPAAAPAGGNY
jgi:hypothetical protein